MLDVKVKVLPDILSSNTFVAPVEVPKAKVTSVIPVSSFADVIVKVSPLIAVEAPPAPTTVKVSLLVFAVVVPDVAVIVLNMF